MIRRNSNMPERKPGSIKTIACEKVLPSSSKLLLVTGAAIAAWATIPHGPTYAEEHNAEVIQCARLVTEDEGVRVFRHQLTDPCQDILQEYKIPQGPASVMPEQYDLPPANVLISQNTLDDDANIDHTYDRFETAFLLSGVGLAIEGALALRRSVRRQEAPVDVFIRQTLSRGE